MGEQIKLIVGLGNPGPQYVNTRHNAGFWLIEALAAQHSVALQPDVKFNGRYGKITLAYDPCHLLLPMTFMNDSGRAVQNCAHFYKLNVNEILVAHDELDFPPGDIRVKQSGGHAGHNGLRSIINYLGNNDFYRLRIGIGHPGNKDIVADYVLNKPSQADRQLILTAINRGIEILPQLVAGNIEDAITQLHSD